MLSEKKKKNLPIGYLIFVLQFFYYSCNFQVPKGLEDLGLLLNLQKFTSATAVSEGNITVTGTVKDASGNIISGGILDISRSASTSVLNRAPADTKVYTDTTGKFSMNIYAGSFSIKVSRSNGTLVGSFALKVIDATTTPEISSATGVQVTGITAAPVGSGGSTGTTGGTTTTTTAPVAFLSIPNGTPSSIAEGASSTIGVIMTGSVTKSYTVTITSSNPSAISVSPASIEITPNNFAISKQITLTANEDDNIVPESVAISLTSTGLNQSDFTVSTVDNDTQNIVIAGVNTINENGSGSITVRLTKEPPSNTTVTLASSNTSSLNLGTSSLTFTPSNFSLPQSITLNGVQDVNTESESITITATAGGVPNQTWNILVLDDDITIQFANLQVSGSEGGPVTVPITLSGNPGSTRTVNFSSNNNPPTLSPGSMTFTTSNYNTPQNLTLTGLTDSNTTTVITAVDNDGSSSTKLITNTWTATTKKYTISGSVSGLITGGSVVLSNKSGYDSLTVSTNGIFTFPKSASTYTVTVQTSPTGQTCTITNGSGTATANVTNVSVSCKSFLNITGVVTTLAGSTQGYQDGTGTSAKFGDYGHEMTFDGTHLYMIDHLNRRIRKINPSTGEVTTFAGSGVLGLLDGTGTNAQFQYPWGITNDGTNLYVTDQACCIRKIVISTGEVTTIVGSANNIGFTDGIGTAAKFGGVLQMITTDGTNLYVVDNGNSNIRKIVISTLQVSTLAGPTSSVSPQSGYADGIGTSVRFYNPYGITTDGTNLYVTDWYRIRKIVTATGEVSTIAGTGSSTYADGTGTGASFKTPNGIVADGTNLWITDYNGHTIRKMVLSTGVVTTIAGSPLVSGFVNGTGSAARFNLPGELASDGTSLYVWDRVNSVIRKIQ